MKLLLCFLVGFVLGGGAIGLIFYYKKPVGSLYAYKSDEDYQTYLYLELFKNMDIVCKKKRVVLKVNKRFLTQK